MSLRTLRRLPLVVEARTHAEKASIMRGPSRPPFGTVLEEYPDLPARALARAREPVGAAVAVLNPTGGSDEEVPEATRDLLDLARGRTSAPHLEVRRELPVNGAGTPVPCLHCQAPIAAGSFGYGSPARQLLFASCPDCRGETTLLTAAWQRLSGLATTGLATS